MRFTNNYLFHFKRALLLQNKPKFASGTQKRRQPARSNIDESVEYHYKLALQLRKNFPLAALNLGSYQYATLNQLAEALSTFELCANQMEAGKTRAFHRHVRVQIECLISAAKLLLSHPEPPSTYSSTATASSWWSPGNLSHAKLAAAVAAGAAVAPTESAGLQTNGATKQTTAVDGSSPEVGLDADFRSKQGKYETHVGCRKVLDWMQEARRRLNQIGLPDAVSDDGGQTRFVEHQQHEQQLGQLGDLSKQMATIHWIEAQCFDWLASDQEPAANGECFKRQDCGSARLGKQLKRAVELAWRSQVSIEAKIYISYADFIHKLGKQDGAAKQVLEQSIEIEQGKLRQAARQQQQQQQRHMFELGQLRYKLAKISKASKETLNQLEEACRHVPNEFHWLTLAGEIAYELGLMEKSESFYLRAVQVAIASAMEEQEEMRSPAAARKADGGRGVDFAHRKLATAHANYGAILQVNGRLGEAREQYRRSLDCNPLNKVSATNLAKLNERLDQLTKKRAG